MKPSLRIRPARESDKKAVLDFCRHTWEHGDYIAYVWNEWLHDPQGRLFVATLDSQPVSIAHATILSQREAWFEGMRVHPNFRGRGIAQAVTCAMLDFARAKGCRVVRLASNLDNFAAHRTAERVGFHKLVLFGRWAAKPLHRVDPKLQRATKRDLDFLRSVWERPLAQRKATGGLMPLGWKWREFGWGDVGDQVRRRKVYLLGNGFAFCERDGDYLEVKWLEARGRDAIRLARALRGLAGQRKLEGVLGIFPNYRPLNEALRASGYVRRRQLWIFERKL